MRVSVSFRDQSSLARNPLAGRIEAEFGISMTAVTQEAYSVRYATGPVFLPRAVVRKRPSHRGACSARMTWRRSRSSASRSARTFEGEVRTRCRSPPAPSDSSLKGAGQFAPGGSLFPTRRRPYRIVLPLFPQLDVSEELLRRLSHSALDLSQKPSRDSLVSQRELHTQCHLLLVQGER